MVPLQDLSTLPNIERNLLKDQVTSLLREMIVTGQIPAGTKITEREVARLLNISRMPARDALMNLEGQGLVVNKPDGRYVIQLDEEEVLHLYDVRLALEKLAIELGIQNLSDRQKSNLSSKLLKLQKAIENNDIKSYIASDQEIHEMIWILANNPYLTKMLHSMSGLIFMFIATQTHIEEDWNTTYELHKALVGAINNSDLNRAIQSLSDHMQHSLQLALQVFRSNLPREARK